VRPIAPTLTHDEAARRYRLSVDGEEVGYVEYDPIGATSILLKHTEVDRSTRGRAMAASSSPACSTTFDRAG
jgi:predicted GNAT family acetyltransferase